MEHNPYAPPAAEVGLVPADGEVPPEVLKKIRNAWIAGTISTGITLVFTLVAMGGAQVLGFSAWQLLDVLFLGGLTYGIYRKSRIAAIVMLAYFVISKILMFVQAGTASGLLMTLIFFYYYAQGVAGTLRYHRLTQGG